jgi:ferredoxin-NADP reductase
MKRFFESFIDSITMYRLVLYGLYLITATAFVLSIFGQISFGLIPLVMTLAVLLIVSHASSKLFAWTFSSPYNPESWQITAFILFFLIFPQANLKGFLLVALVAFLSVASKYILAIRGRHIFNPAAVAVVISSLLGLLGATWWVATITMLPVVTIVGFLGTWKLRHFRMVGVYLLVSVVVAAIVAKIGGRDLGDALKLVVISTPIMFAGSIMLTEPLTSPTTKPAQVFYGILVATLGALQLGWLSKPDVALLFGNAFSFLLGQHRAIKLEFVSATEIAPSIYNVVFKSVHSLRFKAGQYIELTIPHTHADDRGIRRTFSIASRPGTDRITVGLMTASPSSTFKAALLALTPGTIVRATQVGGSFVLPGNIEKPIIMIAGGIGITPFLAMIDDLLARQEKRRIVLFYAVRREELLVYGGVLNQARQQLDIQIIPIVSKPAKAWNGERGLLDMSLIGRYIQNVYDYTYYISGPNAMALSFREQLRAAGIDNGHIKTDYFSGY